MTIRFLTELQNFADAAYPIDDHSLDAIWNLVCTFLSEIAEIDYFEVLQVELQKNGPCLTTAHILKKYWTYSSDPNAKPKPDSFAIRTKGQGRYHDQTAYSFAENVKLWVQEKSHGALATEGAVFVNHWPGESKPKSKPLPPYYAYTGWVNTKTQIVIPLVVRVPIGIIVLETQSIYPYNERLAETFMGIANSLAAILSTHAACEISKAGTKSALSAVAKGYDTTKKNDKEHPLVEPSLFLASGKDADQEVMGIIMEIVSKFHKTVRLNFWQDWTNSDEIHSELMKSVTRADFGICYLSEPLHEDSGSAKYRDNPNVLFEAGMLHALTSSGVGESFSTPVEWLAVREEASPKIPFDFGNRNILVVPRLDDGKTNKLNRQAFSKELTKRLQKMLKAQI